MKIAVGGDHAGFELKQKLLPKLLELGHAVTDLGSFNPSPVDFPDIAKAVSAAILSGQARRGIMFCGSGAGAAIACNKIRGIRASVCHDIYTARQCVEHDDVQIMCLGGQIVGDVLALELIKAFLDAKFSTSEEFIRRVRKLDGMDASRDWSLNIKE